MSRLVVKNLPTKITEEKLREIFSQKGLVTDIQLKYTKDGRFRHFGFIGFKTEEEAKNAEKYFNNTYIKTCKIVVEICAGLGDKSKPQAWSRYAPDSTAYKKEHGEIKEEKTEEIVNLKEEKKKEKKKKSVIEDALEKHKDDPLFLEFMEAHNKGQNGVWGNDALTNNEPEKTDETKSDKGETDSDDDSDSESSGSSEPEKDNTAKKEISDLEYLKMKTVKNEKEEDNDKKENKKRLEEKAPKPFVELFKVTVRGLAYKAKKKDVRHFFLPLKPKSIFLSPKVKGVAHVGFATETEMKKALVKHMSFLAGRRIHVTKHGNENPMSENPENKKDYSKWNDQEESLKNEETVAESGRIFVRNLPFTATEDDIQELFSKHGEVTEVIMPVDRYTRKIKGYATITYLIPENASKAYIQLDGTVFQGRMLHLLPGKAKETLEELLAKEGLSFKDKQRLKKKAEAASSHNWNTLFLGPNAVADLMAETYNTTKDKILESSGKESIAVRLALGETQIVTKMRKFLEESAVRLDAFNQAPKQRSKTVILVKNLPAKTTAAEISEKFMKFGELGRVVLPPSGVTAIVEFLEPSEAKSAFLRLAYTKFKHLPLYLEWAPADTFTEPPSKSKSENKTERKEGDEDEKVEEENVEQNVKENESEEESEDDEPPEPETTLFIKNLNFDTEKEQLQEHFKKCGTIHEVIVAKKKDPKNPGKQLSMGYGFIQFKKKASAEKALKILQHSLLDGHAIEIKRSNRTSNTDVISASKKTKIGEQTGSKILVRNVPFQATHSEIRDLFKTFGEIKALRLPKKMVGTGSHRGFAFIDYYTKHDAKRAFKALCQSTHLYGRRLVLEWAAAEDSIDDIRKRTAENYSEGPLNKTLKKGTANPNIMGDSD